MTNKDIRDSVDNHIGSGHVFTETDKQRITRYILENKNPKRTSTFIPKVISAIVMTSLFMFIIGFSLVQTGLITWDGQNVGLSDQTHDPSHNPTDPTPAPKHESFYLEKIKMVDERTGWAVNQQGQILVTSDGWKTSSKVTPNQLPKEYVSKKLFILDGKRAWMFVKETPNSPINMFFTDNRGDAWHAKEFPDIQSYGIEDVYFLNQQQGWLYTSKPSQTTGIMPLKLYRTTDGGDSWTNVQNNNLDQSQSKWIYFLNKNKGWSIGQKARKNADGFDRTTTSLFETNDGGNHWNGMSLFQAKENEPVTVRKPFVADESLLFPAFQYSAEKGVTTLFVYQYDSGRDEWRLNGKETIETRDPEEIIMSFPNASYGWIVSDHDLYVTTDGGQNWTQANSLDQFSAIYDLQFITRKVGFLVSNAGLYRTTDGGESWIQQYKPS